MQLDSSVIKKDKIIDEDQMLPPITQDDDQNKGLLNNKPEANRTIE